MTITVSSHVDGTRKLRSAIADTARRYPSAVMTPAFGEIAAVGLTSLKRTRRYQNRTGKLRLSSKVEQQRRQATGRFRIGFGIVAGGPTAPYAIHVENRTGFFTEAIRAMQRRGPGILRSVARRQHARFRPQGGRVSVRTIR